MSIHKLAISTWDNKEIEAINEVVLTGKFTMGEKVAKFERKFSEYIGMKYSVMVNSGSSANLLMIAALVTEGRLKKGDEVIVPAVSWSTTYTPLQQYGLKVKFVDIDLDTLNIDIDSLKDAISNKTKLLFLVNLLGNPNDMDKIFAICSKYSVDIIEDNCESLGAVYKSKKCGSFGLMSSHSFFFSHHISTMEGGMISTNNEDTYLILKSLRAHGWTRDLPDESNMHIKSKDDFYEMFNFIYPGYNLRPLEMSGAIGLEQLKKLDNLVKVRRENAIHFLNLMKNKKSIMVQKEVESSSWFGFSIINIDQELSSEDFRKKITELGFEIRPIVAGNFTLNPVIDYFEHEIYGKLQNANFLHENGIFIGNNSIDIKEQLTKLCEGIK